MAGKLKPSEWARVSREARGANETLARINGLLRDGSVSIVNNDIRKVEIYQQELREMGIDGTVYVLCLSKRNARERCRQRPEL